MRPRTQKQPQVKKELCRVLDNVDVDVDVDILSKLNVSKLDRIWIVYDRKGGHVGVPN